MATTKKYVVLADIESIRVPFATFNAALEELATFGEVAVCKFYGYSAKRTKDYGEFIQENSYDALSTLPKKRKGKLDLRQTPAHIVRDLGLRGEGSAGLEPAAAADGGVCAGGVPGQRVSLCAD